LGVAGPRITTNWVDFVSANESGAIEPGNIGSRNDPAPAGTTLEPKTIGGTRSEFCDALRFIATIAAAGIAGHAPLFFAVAG
jgi:hypothetical protein